MNVLLLVTALSFFGFGESGNAVMPLLGIGPGPRGGALGEAGIALADDAAALYWNPAGLARLREHRLQLSHHEWFADIRDEFFHGAFPSGRGGFGFGLGYSGEPDIEWWGENNEPGGTFTTWSGVAGLGWGVTITPEWQAGFGLSGFYEDLHTADGFGGGITAGVLGAPLPFLSLGAVARNVGVGYYGSSPEDLPSQVGIGAAFSHDRLTAVVDAFYPFSGDLDMRGGVEYRPVRALALRAGYRTTPDLATLGWSSGITAGIGAALGNFGVDYSFTPLGALGVAHRVGLSLRADRRGSGAVEIRVVDASTRAPLRGTVALSGVRNSVNHTDRRGELTVGGLIRGQLVIRTSCDAYVPRVDTLLILGDRTQHATLALAGVRYGSIWGVIIDAGTNTPVGGLVTYDGPVRGEQPVPLNTGSFALSGLPTGEYVLTAFGPTDDYVAQACTLLVEPERVTEQDFRLTRRR